MTAITFEVGSLGATVGEALICNDVAGVDAARTGNVTEELLVVSDEFAVCGCEFKILDCDCGDE